MTFPIRQPETKLQVAVLFFVLKNNNYLVKTLTKFTFIN